MVEHRDKPGHPRAPPSLPHNPQPLTTSQPPTRPALDKQGPAQISSEALGAAGTPLTSYYVLNTHDWLHGRLVGAEPPSEFEAAPRASAADMVIYPEPPWLDGPPPRLYRALS